MSGRKLKKGFEFLLNTDWLFQTPIDLEHKQYVLLSYFQKLNERFDNSKYIHHLLNCHYILPMLER